MCWRKADEIMRWVISKHPDYNVGRDSEEIFPALIAEGGWALLFVGDDRGPASFQLKSPFVSFPFTATRYSDGGDLTATWTANLSASERLIANSPGGAYYFENKEAVKAVIEEALMSSPTWPPQYKGAASSAEAVEFI